MCIISTKNPIGLLGRFLQMLGGSRVKVSGTNIFARRDGPLQAIVYSMQVSARDESVMVLPLPVDRAFEPAEEACEFVDLSEYSKLFDDLDRAFPSLFPESPPRSATQIMKLPKPTLVVHNVGAYDASYVPTLDDFDRLDPRFRLPDAVWSALPEYADYGFAVFKLRKGRKNRFHPMAFRFRTREPDGLFFPTVHVHDRQVHARADFDHRLYFQFDAPSSDATELAVVANGEQRIAENGRDFPGHVDVDRTEGIVDPDAGLMRLKLWGELTNEDYRLQPAKRSA